MYYKCRRKGYSFVVLSMKRIVASILAVLYLSTSMGATVHFHYCMGQLVGWGLIDHAGGKNCDFCGMPKMSVSVECMVGMKNCCHEEHKQIKNDKDQKLGQEALRILKAGSLTADLSRGAWAVVFPVSPSISQPVAHGPPLACAVPLFLRNCNFRI